MPCGFGGKGQTSWFSSVLSNCEAGTFHWYPRSGVVLDCIYSRSFPLFYIRIHCIYITRGANKGVSANNKDADQPAHPRSLVSAFVIRYLKGITSVIDSPLIS